MFYISMSLWGVRRVESLELSFGSVLPSVRQVPRLSIWVLCQSHCNQHAASLTGQSDMF